MHSLLPCFFFFAVPCLHLQIPEDQSTFEAERCHKWLNTNKCDVPVLLVCLLVTLGYGDFGIWLGTSTK